MALETRSRSPLVELFRRGEAPEDVRLPAAHGAIALPAAEQLALLVLLSGDRDPSVAAAARATLDRVPSDRLAPYVDGSDVPPDVRDALRTRGIDARCAAPVDPSEPLIDAESEPLPAVVLDEESGATDGEIPSPAEGGPEAPRRVPLSSLSVIQKVKLAMRGTREQRTALVRDANRLVAVAVLSSPKLTASEVEAIARMANVSDEVLRIVGANRAWTKNYAVVSALARNPKTPPAVSLALVPRLNERDMRMLSVDRNVPEGLRVAARKFVASGESRRK